MSPFQVFSQAVGDRDGVGVGVKGQPSRVLTRLILFAEAAAALTALAVLTAASGSGRGVCSFFFQSSLLYSPFFFLSLPPGRNSAPGSHSRLFLPPTHYGSCLAFLSREDFSSFFPRRLASNCAHLRH